MFTLLVQPFPTRLNAGRAALLSASAISFGVLLTPTPARAECVPAPLEPKQVLCTGADADGFSDLSDAVDVTVEPGATVAGQIALDDNNRIANNGVIVGVVVDNGNTIVNGGTVNGLIFIGNTNTLSNSGTIAVNNAEAIFSGEQNNSLENTGIISTTGNGREAVQFLGVGSILTGNGSISTQGADAEGVEFGTNATITYSGNIATLGANSHAIRVGLDSTVTLLSGAALITEGDGAIGIFNLDDGLSVSVIEAGASIVTMGANASTIIDADDAQITLGGLLQTSGANAHAVDIDDDSSVTIGATGSISTIGDGARGMVIGRRSTVNNAGSIVASGAGADGILFDEGRATLINSGSITSMQAYGILLDDDEPATSSSITNLAGGTISGALGSVATAGLAEADGTEDSLFNYGSLVGDVTLGAASDLFALYDAGSVIGSIFLGSGDDQFFIQDANSALVTGSIDGGDGFDRADARFFADGTLDLSRTSGFEFYTVSTNGTETDVTIAAANLTAPIAISGDGQVINNANVTVAGDEALVLIDDGLRLTNRGALITTGAGAEALIGGNNITITHEGVIQTADSDAEGIQAGNGALVTLSAGSTIETFGDGAEGVQAGDSASVTVAGSVVTSGANSEGVQLNEMAMVEVVAGGSISTSGEGAEGIQFLDNGTATISGQVVTTGAFSEALQGGRNASIIVTSTGVLQSAAADTFALNVDQARTLSNQGQILANGEGNAAAIFVGAGVQTLTNAGLINSQNDVAIFVSDEARSEASTITNLEGGTISGATGSIVAFSDEAPTVEIVTNAGTLVGDVELFAGDDRFTHLAGGSFAGEIIDLGAGNDTFTIAGGSLTDIGGLIFGGSGIDSFVYQSGASDIAASAVFEFERLEQLSGTLTTTDDLTFDTVVLSGGTLYLSSGTRIFANDFNNAAARTSVTIGTDATLAGAGEVVGSVINNGTIDIDAGQVFSIVGDLALNSGSLVDMDMSASDDAILTVGGAAHLDGGTLRLGGVIESTRTITLISAAGGVVNTSGLILDFDNNFPFAIASDLAIGANDVTLRVDQLLLDPSLGGAAADVGQYVFDQLLVADPAFFAAAQQVSDATTRENLEAVVMGLSPEIYASAPIAASITQNRTAMRALTGNLADPAAKGVRLWGTLELAEADFDAAAPSASFNLRTTGGVAGVDAPFGERLRLGLYGGFGQSESVFTTGSGRLDADQLLVGGYAAIDAGDFNVTAAASYASIANSASRALAGGVTNMSTGADFDTTTVALHLGGLWRAPTDALEIVADASFDYLMIEREGLSESGGSPLALVVDAQDENVPLATVGLQLGQPLQIRNLTVVPRGNVRFVHNFGDTAYSASARFASGTEDRLVLGSAVLPDDMLEGGIGLDLRGSNWSAGAEFLYGTGSDFQSAGGRLAMSYRF